MNHDDNVLAISNSVDLSEVRMVFVEAIREVGFSYCMYGFIYKDENPESALYALYTNYPETFCGPYFDDFHGSAHDEVGLKMFESEEIFIWDSLHRLVESDLRPASKKTAKSVTQLAYQHQFFYGATLPCWKRDDFVFVCGVTNKGQDSKLKQISQDMSVLKRIQKLGEVVCVKLLGEDYNLLDNELVRTNYLELKDEQLEYLSHKASGYQDNEIADNKQPVKLGALGAYRRRIVESLKARNIVEAVHRAKVMKLIK